MALITSITPTLCSLLAIEPPNLSDRQYLPEVIEASRAELSGRVVQRCLIFAPDAIAAWLAEKHPSKFDEVLKHAPLRLRLRSVVPPKTPVCWASVFTGALPEVHGIRKYERPVLQCDTFFDAAIRARKRVAIVAVATSSMEIIFRGRELDYFAELYDPHVTNRALNLLKLDTHDIIIAYQCEYDDLIHETTPESEQALHAVDNHIWSFTVLARAFSEHWRNYDRAIMWLTDHGTHVDATTGNGTHGEDIPADMIVEHFFGFQRVDRR